MKIHNHYLTFTSDLKERQLDDIKLIILHHRAGDGDIEGIHQWHKKRGWAGVGYHYYIMKDGTVHKGRDINYIGSHCKGCNTSSIGICLEGNFKNEMPTGAQLTSLTELCLTLKASIPSIKRVLNHNDLYKTECPIIDLKDLIQGVNSDGRFII